VDVDKSAVIGLAVRIARILRERARSRQISVKFRTLIRYAWAAYRMGIMDLARLRGVSYRCYPPPTITNNHFYRKVEEALVEELDAEIVYRRGIKYLVLRKED